jgi:cyclopropane fatty-acyl-phospholipid synthase-like methyltransferase
MHRHDETERADWLVERRAAVRAAYDDEAAEYDQHPYPNKPQQAWVRRLLATCPAGATVLDAPCGTGRYFPLVADAGHHVVGIDQSAEMLAQARHRGGADELHHVGLQELGFRERFDAIVTIDAMENVGPEDWPTVLTNLRRALKPRGRIYLTVEEQHDADLDAEHRALLARGIPAVLGEVVSGDVAGYHFYPTRDQVREWLGEVGLTIADSGYQAEDGWGYWHLLVEPADTAQAGQPHRPRVVASSSW